MDRKIDQWINRGVNGILNGKWSIIRHTTCSQSLVHWWYRLTQATWVTSYNTISSQEGKSESMAWRRSCWIVEWEEERRSLNQISTSSDNCTYNVYSIIMDV